MEVEARSNNIVQYFGRSPIVMTYSHKDSYSFFFYIGKANNNLNSFWNNSNTMCVCVCVRARVRMRAFPICISIGEHSNFH